MASVCAVRAAGAAPAVKLNGDLPLFGNVDPHFQFSPDGSRVLYLANQNSVSKWELFTTPITGGEPLTLNGPLAPGGNVLAGSPTFTPDGNRVLYVADQETAGTRELFSVPSAGGAATKLNEPLALMGDVDHRLQVSPDGNRVLYVADQNSDEVYELFSVPTAGGTVVRLSREQMAAGGDVVPTSVRFSPDGSRVIYLADQDDDGTIELFSVESAGGSIHKLNGALAQFGQVFEEGLQFSPDGDEVLFVATQREHPLTFQTIAELFVVPSGGGTPMLLNEPLPVGRNVLPASVQFTPDGSRVLYIADQDTDEVYELFSVPRSGGMPTKLNRPLAMGEDVADISVKLSPDGTRVLFSVEQSAGGIRDLFHAAVVGGEAVWVGGTAGGQGRVDPLNVWWSPDGNYVVYRAGDGPGGANGLYSFSIEVASSVPLYVPMDPTRTVVNARITPDGRRVVYLADQNIDNVFELFVVPISGGTPVRISSELVNGGDVTHWQISPDGRHVVYRANQEVEDRFDLYCVAIESGVPGDFNGDGQVDAGDYVRWRNHLGETDEANISFNGDGDGITTSDYTWWKQHYGNPGAGSGGLGATVAVGPPGVGYPVPEPTADILLIVFALSPASLCRPVGPGRTRQSHS